jgi:hypothetical protein
MANKNMKRWSTALIFFVIVVVPQKKKKRNYHVTQQFSFWVYTKKLLKAGTQTDYLYSQVKKGGSKPSI